MVPVREMLAGASRVGFGQTLPRMVFSPLLLMLLSFTVDSTTIGGATIDSRAAAAGWTTVRAVSQGIHAHIIRIAPRPIFCSVPPTPRGVDRGRDGEGIELACLGGQSLGRETLVSRLGGTSQSGLGLVVIRFALGLGSY